MSADRFSSMASDEWARRNAENSMAQDQRDSVRRDDQWPVLPVVDPLQDTLRFCKLDSLRHGRGYLTGAEAFELQEIEARQRDRARAADLAHDQATEAHAYPVNQSLHDD